MASFTSSYSSKRWPSRDYLQIKEKLKVIMLISNKNKFAIHHESRPLFHRARLFFLNWTIKPIPSLVALLHLTDLSIKFCWSHIPCIQTVNYTTNYAIEEGGGSVSIVLISLAHHHTHHVFAIRTKLLMMHSLVIENAILLDQSSSIHLMLEL